MEYNDQSYFELCPHNRENPYVMISREMAQDKSISPKAKGVLLYLLSLPKNWKIYHSQLQEGLNVGEDYINSAMEELINAGYADRIREKVKGKFQPYKYIIREFKKCLPNGENRPGFSGPENPALQNTYRESKIDTKETTTKESKKEVPKVPIEETKSEATPLPAAAVFSKKLTTAKKTYHTCLEHLDIPIEEKIWISETYDFNKVQHAVAWATHKDTTIKKSLVQAIKWACSQEKLPEIPKNSENTIQENKNFCEKTLSLLQPPIGISVEILSQCVEFVFLTAQKEPVSVKYEDSNFKQKFQRTIVDFGFRPKQE